MIPYPSGRVQRLAQFGKKSKDEDFQSLIDRAAQEGAIEWGGSSDFLCSPVDWNTKFLEVFENCSRRWYLGSHV
jgi:hypothetical protein